MKNYTFNFSVFPLFSYLATIFIIALFNISSAIPAEQAGIHLIVVDPKVRYSASSQDDLSLIRQYFQGASWEMPIPPETWQRLQPLGISRFRLINNEASNMVQVDLAKKELQFNFSSLLPGLQDCRKYRLRPHIIVGQVPQVALAIQKEEEVYGVSDWSLYEKYAYAFLKFVMIEQGFSQADFEVANEPDINGASWLLQEKLPLAAPAMYQAYLQLYRTWSVAAARLAHEHPELKLRVGGPSIGPFTFAFGKFNWSGQFIKDVAAQKLRLDFFSFHFYGNTEALAGLPPFDPYPPLTERIAYFHSHLKSAGLENVPLYATEWGPSYITNETPQGVINGNHVGAAWTARFLMDMAANKVDEGMALTYRDHIDRSRAANNWGWPSFLLSDGVTPKAFYNVALMFSRLPGQRVQTSTTKKSLGVVASADKSKMAILAFNQDWDYPNTKERANTEQVQIRINGLPFNTSRVHMVRYLVDETHSNAHYFYKNGLPITKANSELQQIEEMIIPVINGIIDLPGIQLTPSSVTLWEITVENQSAVSSGVNQSNSYRYVMDDFDRADGILQSSTSRSGQIWTLYGAGAASASISARKFTSASNVYAYLPFNGPITTISGTFSFAAGIDNGNRPLTLIADKISGGLSDMLHLNFGPTGWSLNKRLGGQMPPWPVLASNSYDLLTDGTVYNISMSISGNTVVIHTPDGHTTTVEDNDIGVIAPQFGGWQIRPMPDSAIGYWHGVSMGQK